MLRLKVIDIHKMVLCAYRGAQALSRNLTRLKKNNKCRPAYTLEIKQGLVHPEMQNGEEIEHPAA